MSHQVRFVCALLFPILLAGVALAADDEGFDPIFDGKTLEGWDGNPEFWSVKEGAITGQTTAEKPTKGNTFIIWRKGEVGDFELRLQYKIIKGNSGIQYRSFEVPNDKWVVGGYQADFEAGDTYSGINYGERFGGILANRGQKTVVKNRDGGRAKVEVVSTVGESAEIQKKIKKEDWNDYHIIGKGFTFEHRINGVTTSICTDEDTKERRDKGIIALQLHAGPPMTVQFRNIRLKKLGGAAAPEKDDQAGNREGKGKKIVFVAGRPSHAYGDHEHNAGCILLAKELKAAMPEYETVVQQNGWPQEESIFDGADCIVMYCDGGGGHMAIPHLDKIDALAKKGVGIVCIHYGVEVPAGKPGEKFLDWIGGYFEAHWSVNPHWTAKFAKLPDHPIARGVQPFEINDEWYYHMRFRPEMKGVTPILTDLPPKETLSRRDGAHSGNPHVRAAIAKGERQHVAWAAERDGGGRGFGFTGGHFHWNWGDPNFRKVMLNAIVWCAHGEVPTSGVESPPVTLADLEANQDMQPGANFDREAVRKRLKLPPDKASGGRPDKASGGRQPPDNRGAQRRARPAFASPIVTAATKGHAVEVDADITGARQLFLVVTDGGDGFGCDWADWAEPRLVGPAGEKKLTDLKWKSAQTQFGNVEVNKNCTGKEMKIAGQSISYGIGTHANSVIAFDLPEGYTRFKARAGLDNGGTDQGCGSTVQFFVFTQQPPARLTAGTASADNVSREPQDAVAGLDVADGLEATLFASEPQISNITSIDIDHLGRVWACEVKNYRKHNGSRPEGDRILVLEDTDGDGIADKTTVFYQGRDIDSAHGICVLGSRVIVSANDRVQVLYDENGDLKADEKRDVLFSGIGGTQHDHGIHAFIFGPDGKLYFNFGNSGNQLKDKHGKIVVDQAGNPVVANRKPYQEGMVFRCNMDGSGVETLGWNFRNNWEVAVDSFGTLWQSDNDDDGNKGVRINYVMEFGNYGYKDEFTGAGWQQERENWEKEIPERHWHLNDPGVVPTMLLTGAGSPTGICVYEGTLLPKVFHNQVIHCDAGPNVTRAYVATKDGAGYKAESVNILFGARDNWFRPSDVCVAPDGSLFVADWYDPGVGGHNQQEVDRGRIFRVAPPGSKYSVPKFDFATVEGCLKALENANLNVRYHAVTSLVSIADKAHHPVEEAIEKAADPRLKARLLWVLAQMPGEGEEAVVMAALDNDADVRVTAVRIAQRLGLDAEGWAGLAKDRAPEVRRELAIALRHSKSTKAPQIWAELAAQHDGKDRWYLEALGIGAEGKWDACLDAYLAKVDGKWNTPAGRDIIWRSRGKKSADLLVQILKDTATTEDQQPRYLRALDFLAGPEKEAALKKLLE
ncbi:MAG TPA: PVC-type heme-binding CxxCH protein [Pirellulaceae bacterium]|nr:PVC-type heme-binding CxxCH protein [Pirellulaceae bacterium]